MALATILKKILIVKKIFQLSFTHNCQLIIRDIPNIKLVMITFLRQNALRIKATNPLSQVHITIKMFGIQYSLIHICTFLEILRAKDTT